MFRWARLRQETTEIFPIQRVEPGPLTHSKQLTMKFELVKGMILCG